MGLDQQLTRYDPQKVGALVRHMRTVACLYQDELGDKLGLHRASITRIESGTHTISLEKLMLAAKVCGFELCVSVSRK